MNIYRGYDPAYQYVYFMVGKLPRQKKPLIKIGYSWNPALRMTDIARESKAKNLSIMAVEKYKGYDDGGPYGGTYRFTSDAKKREKELHQKFAQYRVIGEWFKPSLELLKHIIEAQNEMD